MIQNSQITCSSSPFQAKEVYLRGDAFAPHRHDTYTFAITRFGVQSFNYRRALRHSLPGQVVVLHPDELHDGCAGTEVGFCYRSISIDPEDIRAGSPNEFLPHIEGGIALDRELVHAVQTLCSEVVTTLDLPEREDAFDRLVLRLQAVNNPGESSTALNLRAAKSARKFIDENLFAEIDLDQISVNVDMDRWELSRTFKAVYGTSPYRYSLYRRLDAARQLLIKGLPLSETAVACAFFDQSHFTRHFKKAFGLTPGKWVALLQ